MRVLDVTSPPEDHMPDGVKRVDYESAVDGVRDWLLLWPGERRDLWIVVIHGHGSHGDQIFTRPDVRRLWLPKFRDTGGGLLSVNLRDNAWMGPAALVDMRAVMTYLRSEWGAVTAVFACGSMGGTSALIYAVNHPDDVQGLDVRGAATDLTSYHAWCQLQTKPILQEIADAIVASYGGSPDQKPDVYQKHSTVRNAHRLTMPVHFSHGDADETIPVEQERALAEAMTGRDNFRRHEIPGGNHDSPIAHSAGFDWIMGQLSETDH